MGETFKSNARPAAGPDSFPYLIAYRAPDADVPGGQTYSMSALAKVALANHCGIAIYERATTEAKAVWIFSLGEAILLARNTWQAPDPKPAPTLGPGGKVEIGTPSLDAIPMDVRRTIGAFLRFDHVPTPKIALVIMEDASGKRLTPYMLIPDLPPSLYPTTSAWQAELHRIQWLLPPTFDVMQPPTNQDMYDYIFNRVTAIDASSPASK
jgi:hypothetical protein